jgi:hypothetical protein
MTDERPPGVLDSLPHTRPHRRSAKRAQVKATPEVPETPRASAEAAAAKTASNAQTNRKARSGSQTRAASDRRRAPAAARRSTPAPASAAATEPPARAPTDAETSHGPVETAVGAAAELAEIGLHASARALRGALSRLPRP